MNIKKISISVFLVAIILLGYMINISEATSYLSADPKACINCHVMNTQYVTWKNSSHASVAGCVDCHLPRDNFVEKYWAKSVDGWNHSVAFTLDTYDYAIQISDYGAERVQKNCISCHSSATSTISSNADKYHKFDAPNVKNGRKCWDCHKSVPHGKVRSITMTPYSLSIK
ncbi:MAG: cytochrome c nitrite reductase small subunit [Melioribacteraceae bacterium]|nr:cytochrome c nitrite reductase small subunit [Melioribacteraceae bacterium]